MIPHSKRFGFALAMTVATLFAAPAARASLAIQTWTTPGGTKVFFVESRALPIVDVQVDFRAAGAEEVIEAILWNDLELPDELRAMEPTLRALLMALLRSTTRHILRTISPNTGIFCSSCLARKRKTPGYAWALRIKSRDER